MFLHSDFSYSYTFNWVGCCTDHFASTALTEEQLGQHEILRRHGELRSPPQDDTVSFEGGCAPFTPALIVLTQLSVFCAYCYLNVFYDTLSVV